MSDSAKPRMRLRRPLQVHQHDDEQVQDDDPAGVDEDLNRGEKLRAEQHVERRDEEEVEHQEQHAVHGVSRADHQHREPEDARRNKVERDRFAH
jgi:hypothetical protein